MDTELVERIEICAERAASAVLGASAGVAAYRLLGGLVHGPWLAASAAGAAVLLSLACALALGSASPRRDRFSVSSFPLPEIDPTMTSEPVLVDADRPQVDELILTDADRLDADELVLSDADRLDADELLLSYADRLDAVPLPGSEAPLMLDDILAEIGPDSRVVRLFDRKAMPTPGQLKSRIDHHLARDAGRAGTTDASEALSEALAELRRSLRYSTPAR